jgi:hypothetical protein
VHLKWCLQPWSKKPKRLLNKRKSNQWKEVKQSINFSSNRRNRFDRLFNLWNFRSLEKERLIGLTPWWRSRTIKIGLEFWQISRLKSNR